MRKLVPAVAGFGAAFALLTVPSTASAQSSHTSVAQTQSVHRASAACTSPRGKRINASWGDGNVSTTVYFNNHCNQKRWIELKFVKQNHDFFWKCFSVNPRTSGKKKIDNSMPDKVVITKKKANCPA
ncbi:hypothetical protein SAMN05444920_12257 [Nonomuraea solani]|uniref:Uncharacterized protein n=1 Tax=Nonomuraea solani TaxID=1144553 RepID=A0A1H6EXW3_9ACTN|nr:hypothetical protein [Nonomuraea solani]SEH01806.1 hypothetical protein SAMN05444920_12257 [Nonomuraea solani]